MRAYHHRITGLLGLLLLTAIGSVVASTPAHAVACIYQDAPPGFIRWGDSSNCYLMKVNSDGSINANATFTPSGTQDVNLKQIGGATVAQGHGTAAAALRVELPTDGTGVVTANLGTLNGAATSAKQDTLLTALGSPFQASGALGAGTAIIGKVGIDQTTPGTTNAVSATNFPSTVSVNTGATGASSPRVTVAVDSATVAGSASLPAGSAVIGHVIVDTTSTTAVTQATASNLNAQVVGTVAAAAADSGNPVKVGCKYNSTLPTYTDGQRTDCQSGTRGSANTTLYVADAVNPISTVATNADGVATSSLTSRFQMAALGYNFNGTTWDRARSIVGAVAAGSAGTGTVAVEETGRTFCHISTATTTTCKSGAGYLHTLTVNGLGTVASTTTVYDNTAGSGTVIAVINTLAGQESYMYDVAFATGLTLVTTGTVAPDITVSYR